MCCARSSASRAAGFKEIALTGVHLGSYGRDLTPRVVADRACCARCSSVRAAVSGRPSRTLLFRISSLEPMDCSPEIVDLVARVASLRAAFPSAAAACEQPHAGGDAPAVHDRVLRGARRRHPRARCPHASIGSDIIVGFPGETDDDFEQLAAYLERSPLTHLHVFPYSDRPGTAASAMAARCRARSSASARARVREIGASADRAVPRVAGRHRPSRR